MELKNTLDILVVLIGIFMIIKFYTAVPPLLSGIAFIALGAKGLWK